VEWTFSAFFVKFAASTASWLLGQSTADCCRCMHSSSAQLFANLIRDSNHVPIFSILGFGIETFLILGSRRDYITTITPSPNITVDRRPQFTHQSCRTWYDTWSYTLYTAKTILLNQCNSKLTQLRNRVENSPNTLFVESTKMTVHIASTLSVNRLNYATASIEPSKF
jgi:hypothetical protein